MFDLNDIEVLEGPGDYDREAEVCSLQRAINSGMWTLQGTYGRNMMDAIERGECMLGENGCRDYYGNYIPARDQVEEGTKGSRGFVVKHFGEDWAQMLEAV